jgi:hypothetical protein
MGESGRGRGIIGDPDDDSEGKPSTGNDVNACVLIGGFTKSQWAEDGDGIGLRPFRLVGFW